VTERSIGVFRSFVWSRLVPIQPKPKRPKLATVSIVLKITEIIASPSELMFQYLDRPLSKAWTGTKFRQEYTYGGASACKLILANRCDARIQKRLFLIGRLFRGSSSGGDQKQEAFACCRKIEEDQLSPDHI
jgi:hypothetical protein